jgi:hypothetical protein
MILFAAAAVAIVLMIQYLMAIVRMVSKIRTDLAVPAITPKRLLPTADNDEQECERCNAKVRACCRSKYIFLHFLHDHFTNFSSSKNFSSSSVFHVQYTFHRLRELAALRTYQNADAITHLGQCFVHAAYHALCPKRSTKNAQGFFVDLFGQRA